MVSFSGGKDSTAMLLRMLELGMQVDEIVFADTEFEFPELYTYIKRIEKYIGRKITILKPEAGLFKKWFYGATTRGRNKGKVRGFPLVVYPCWWTREAKIKPLVKVQKDAEAVYIGIAYDEKERMSKVDGNIKYPLVEWKWTEQDCIDYLNSKGLFNPLYVNFDRLGCFFCQKQSQKSLFVLWKNYPKLWKKMLWWDKETKRVGDRWIRGHPLHDLQKKFEAGHIPKRLPKYECWNGCESVKRAFKQRQLGTGAFVEIQKSKILIEQSEGGKV